MRYTEEHKQAVRARIVEAAAHALRGAGLDGVSIAALMKKVGLTHGGFYAHFQDRDELLAEAITFAAEQTGQSVFSEEAGGLKDTITAYLSKEHLHSPAGGCVLAALGTDATRQREPVRRAFAGAARGFIRLLEKKLHPNSPSGTLSNDTLVLASRMLGAIVLARLVRDEQLAERILAAARGSSPQ
jgi:TetR/AcrR family transcriptional regulator, transcriptional repressor for nem operon